MNGDERTPSRADDVFFQLSHPRRRALVLLLAASPTQSITLRTAASIIYALEQPVQANRAPTREVTNLRTNLKRSHLPQLTASGLLHRDGDQLTPGPAFGVSLDVLLSAGYWFGTANHGR